MKFPRLGRSVGTGGGGQVWGTVATDELLCLKNAGTQISIFFLEFDTFFVDEPRGYRNTRSASP